MIIRVKNLQNQQFTALSAFSQLLFAVWRGKVGFKPGRMWDDAS